ncbi:MAG: hypothetical protein KDD44_12300, partial [Bdellovibrionales bacterium]|nr:hypothetical protein [Bdellovibrionales bacterium]
MWIEFQLLVRDAAQHLLAQRGQTGQVPPDPLLVDCPDHVAGDIGTPVVFLLAPMLGVPPQETAALAEELEEAFGRLQNQRFSEPWFECVVAPTGHLNASACSVGVRSFLASCRHVPLARLLAFQSVLDRQGSREVERTHPLWSSANAFKSLEGDPRADVQAFFVRLTRQGEISFDDYLMSLALIRDPQLEAIPFEQGLVGTQHVPWFLRRAARDAESFAEACAGSRQSADVPPMSVLAQRALDEVVASLLNFRRTAHSGGYSGKPLDPSSLTRSL